MKFSMTEHGFDTATSFGSLSISSNDEHGFRPYQLLVSSIAVCSGGVLRNILEKMRMPAEEMTIEVREVNRIAEEANRVKKIHLHFILKGEKIEDNKLPRAFDLTQKNCSMVQSVAGAIEVVETFEVIR